MNVSTIARGKCDCHVHIFRPDRFPFSARRNYTPGPATVEDLLTFEQSLEFDRVVLVQASVYDTDNRCLLDGLRCLGNRARGVAVIDKATPDIVLDELGHAGVRGIRLNLEAEGISDRKTALRRLREAASRVSGRGWHIEVATTLPLIVALADQIEALPTLVVLDHFAGAKPDDGQGQPDFERLLALAKSGRVYVKLSAAYRISRHHHYADVAGIARALITAAPEKMLWASDWPHTAPRRAGHTPDQIDPFFDIDDIKIFRLLDDWVPNLTTRSKILVENPAQLYGFPRIGI